MTLVGDATRLRQILVNLLTNAVKFTDEGEVVLSVDSKRVAEGDGSGAEIYELHFAVRDTGIGIPKERIDRLFHSFSQVDASTTRRYGGTGLGLAISKRLSEMMGGTMWVESEAGKGSVFHFTVKAEAGPVLPNSGCSQGACSAARQASPCRRRQRCKPRSCQATGIRLGDGAARDGVADGGPRVDPSRRSLRYRHPRPADAGYGRPRTRARDPPLRERVVFSRS